VARDRAVAHVLERFGIAHLAPERIDALSGGERQRVALARAVAAGPRALLLDEPLSALDASTRGRVASELGEHLRRLGLPAVLVSHDFADVVGLADRVAVMEAGRIVQTGAAAELLEAPASAFVAAFAGVNWFAGTASRRGHLTAVRTTDDAVFLSTQDAEGPVGAVVYPWDVALSTTPPEGSSMNALHGPVQRVAVVGNRARVSVGSHPSVVAEVTDESVERMGLAPGVRVVATWKATGTRLVPRSPSAGDG
jgi:ABC-type sulfate/molybdate transport systems ATPase subunit